MSELKVFHLLREYSPTLAGTVPLDLDLPGSDLDILCYTKNLDKFEEEVVQQFGKQAQFTISQKSIRGRLSVVARFDTESWPIEIFAQNTRVEEQPGWLHLKAEHRYLQQYGEQLHNQVLNLKRLGDKTEPAFCQALGIEGDPYEQLIKINLETERLTIRSITIEDAPALFGYRQDRHVNRYQGWIPESLQDAYSFIQEKCFPYVDVEDTWHQVVVTLKESEQVIGDMALHFTGEGAHIVELGIAFDSDYHGKGYAREAMDRLLGFVFDHFRREKAMANIDPRNESSIRLFKKLGFTEEAHLKESSVIRGEKVDDVYFGLLREEYKAS